MSMYRVKHMQDMTVLPTKLMQDTTLSYRARGVAAMLWTMPDTWDRDLRDLITPHDNCAQIVAALKELIQAEYLESADEAREDA
jgi:hypothetical protein